MAVNRIKRAIAAFRGSAAPQAKYLRGLSGGAPSHTLSAPTPVLRDASDDVRSAWAPAAARAVDALHNNGWISGVVDQMTALMVGDGLRPNLEPDFSWAGWNESQSAEWARMTERLFAAWAGNAYECDAGGRFPLAQIQAAAVRQWFATGEVIVELPTIRRPGGRWGTKVRQIPAHHLSTKSDGMSRLEHGVYLDQHGAPAGYLFEFEERFPYRQVREVRRAARDGMGRVIVLHVFDGVAGQIRGITPLAPILRVLRDYDQLANATLMASMIHAVFAATIESSYPSADVLDALRVEEEDESAASRFTSFMLEKIGWAKSVDIDLGRAGRIPHLMPGENLKLHSSSSPNAQYEAFASFLLREIARAAGAMFEDLTGDYRGATYSSVRMAIAKQWPLLMYRRRHIPQPVCQGAFDAWLEEAVDVGAVPMPGGMAGFLANKASVCKAEWRGPAKPQADDLKSAKAHEIYRNMGVITDEQIAADLGFSIDGVYTKRAYERGRRQEVGVHGGLVNGATDADAEQLLNESADEGEDT